MEVSNKEYSKMAKDYKEADKIYSRIKSPAAFDENYDYKKCVVGGIEIAIHSPKK